MTPRNIDETDKRELEIWQSISFDNIKVKTSRDNVLSEYAYDTEDISLIFIKHIWR